MFTDSLSTGMLEAWAYQASLSADWPFVLVRYKGAVGWQAWIFAARKTANHRIRINGFH
jgi:hypothetical protein